MLLSKMLLLCMNKGSCLLSYFLLTVSDTTRTSRWSGKAVVPPEPAPVTGPVTSTTLQNMKCIFSHSECPWCLQATFAAAMSHIFWHTSTSSAPVVPGRKSRTTAVPSSMELLNFNWSAMERQQMKTSETHDDVFNFGFGEQTCTGFSKVGHEGSLCLTGNSHRLKQRLSVNVHTLVVLMCDWRFMRSSLQPRSDQVPSRRLRLFWPHELLLVLNQVFEPVLLFKFIFLIKFEGLVEVHVRLFWFIKSTQLSTCRHKNRFWVQLTSQRGWNQLIQYRTDCPSTVVPM